MKQSTTPNTQLDKAREAPSLDERYGKIGISAVAAALRYQSESKNLAYAPVTPRDDQQRDEAA